MISCVLGVWRDDRYLFQACWEHTFDFRSRMEGASVLFFFIAIGQYSLLCSVLVGTTSFVG